MSMELFQSLEKQYSLPAGILDAMWETESGRGKSMLSPKGAQGHFQFMPATAEQYNVNVSDLKSSATGAARYMNYLMQQFNGDVRLALAAYNAGPGTVRKYNGIPPFKETQNYVQKIGAKLGGASTAAEELDLGEDELDLGDTEVDVGKVDWQSELDKEAGVWVPAIASIAGGILGGTAGSPGGPIGVVAGGTAGSIAGSSLAIVNNIKDHPAPFEEKLKYLTKQGLIDMALSAGTAGISKVLRPLIKKLAKTPQEIVDAEKFFAERGLNLTPQVGAGAKGGVNVYRDAAEKMSETLDDAITVIRKQFASARTPDQLGRELNNGLFLLKKARGDWADTAFSPFRKGSAWGSGVADMTPVADEAKSILREIGLGWKKPFGDVKPRTVSILEEAADFAGKGDDVAGLIAKRRQLQDALEDEGKLLTTIDNARKVRLFKAIDDRVEEALKASPGGDAAARAYRAANAKYREMSSMLESEVISALIKKDPMMAANTLGKMASPSSVREFNRVLAGMVKARAVSPETAEEVLNSARASWISDNFRKLGSVASLHPTHKDFDKAGKEAFNALFANSPYKGDLALISNNAKVIEEMLQKLPNRGDHIPAGAFSLAAAAGSTIAQSPGAVGAMTGVWSATHIPQMLANAAVSGDKGLINAIKFVTTWSARNAPSTLGQAASRGAMFGIQHSTVPPAVMQAFEYIDAKAREQGLIK